MFIYRNYYPVMFTQWFTKRNTAIQMDDLNSISDKQELVDLEKNDDNNSKTKRVAEKKYNKKVIIASCVYTIWTLIVVLSFLELGVIRSDFYRFGPSSTLVIPFINIHIDNWWRWSEIAIYCVLNQGIGIYVGDMIYPWIVNTAMDPESKLDMSPLITWILTNIYFILPGLDRLFTFAISYTQIDFLLLQLITTVFVGSCTNGWIIFNKI